LGWEIRYDQNKWAATFEVSPTGFFWMQFCQARQDFLLQACDRIIIDGIETKKKKKKKKKPRDSGQAVERDKIAMNPTVTRNRD
jgi:hypothetical protein